MDGLVWLGVAVLGGAGALLRLGLDALVQRRLDAAFPYGTLAVNGSGSLCLGILVGVGLGGNALLLAGSATIGSFTTFSTWLLESQRLAEEGESLPAAANVVASFAVGLAAALAGRWLGATL